MSIHDDAWAAFQARVVEREGTPTMAHWHIVPDDDPRVATRDMDDPDYGRSWDKPARWSDLATLWQRQSAGGATFAPGLYPATETHLASFPGSGEDVTISLRGVVTRTEHEVRVGALWIDNDDFAHFEVTRHDAPDEH